MIPDRKILTFYLFNLLSFLYGHVGVLVIFVETLRSMTVVKSVIDYDIVRFTENVSKLIGRTLLEYPYSLINICIYIR